MKEENDALVDKTLTAVSDAICSCNNPSLLDEILPAVITLSVGVLRSVKGDEFVEGFLSAVIEDKANVIEVELQRLQ